MQNLLEELQYVLKDDERIILNDGSYSKNKLMELALNLDEKLLNSLLRHENIKSHFFKKVGEALVFNQQKFIQFIQNKQLFEDSYTSYKNIIGLKTDKGYLKNINDVSLVWAYKDCVLEGGQDKEDAKRNEIFYNELLAPDEINRLFDKKVLTNWKRFDANGEHEVDFINDNDNLIVKGNNLIALHTLKEKFRGKIKLIYIDPPYNTGGDSFKYNDRFNHSSWLTFMKNRLEVSRELLSDDGAIFVQIDHHEVAYLTVLMDEIFGKDNFVQLITVKTSSPAGFKTVNPGPIDVTEYILFYTKRRSSFKFKKQYVATDYDHNYNLVILNKEEHPTKWKFKHLRDVVYEMNGIEVGNTPQQSAKNAEKVWGEHWKIIREQLMAAYALENADKVVSVRDPHKPTEKLKELLKESKKHKDKVFIYEKSKSDDDSDEQKYIYVMNGGALSFYSNKVKELDGIKTPTELLTNLWLDISWDGIANEGGVTLKNGKKPEKLLKRIIESATEEGDIVLDFFLGSGTTAAVAHKMNRQYIGIEQLDYGKNDSVNRLKNVIKGDKTGISSIVGWEGGGSFVYVELMKLNEAFIEKIQAANDTNELLEIWKEMKEQAFFRYDIDLEKIDNTVDDFKKLSFENQKKLLIECLDKNNLYVNLSEMEDITYNISEKDKELNRIFYNIGDSYGK